MDKVCLLGNVGQDPELRYTASGTPVTNISVATKRVLPKERDGQPTACPDGWGEYGSKWTKTKWFRCTAWRGLAEMIAEHVKKGQMVYLEGEATGEVVGGIENPRVWSGNDGVPKASFEMLITKFEFAGQSGSGGGGGRAPEEPSGYRPDSAGDDVDIPF